MLASAACTLKLRLYIEAQKGLSANMKLDLPGIVAHSNLSFRCFKDHRKKYVEDACSKPGPPTWEISVFKMERNLAFGSVRHTCNPVTMEC